MFLFNSSFIWTITYYLNSNFKFLVSPLVTIKNLPYTTARNLSKLCGKIISTKFVLGNIAQLKTRNINKIIQAELKWDKRIRLHENDKAIQKIIFWRDNLIRLNSCVLYPYQDPNCFYLLRRKQSRLIRTIFKRRERIHMF